MIDRDDDIDALRGLQEASEAAYDADLATLRADLARVTAEREEAVSFIVRTGEALDMDHDEEILDGPGVMCRALYVGRRLRDFEALHAEERPVHTKVRLLSAQVRELQKVARAAVHLVNPTDDYSLRSTRRQDLVNAVNALPQSMLEEPSDG